MQCECCMLNLFGIEKNIRLLHCAVKDKSSDKVEHSGCNAQQSRILQNVFRHMYRRFIVRVLCPSVMLFCLPPPEL